MRLDQSMVMPVSLPFKAGLPDTLLLESYEPSACPLDEDCFAAWDSCGMQRAHLLALKSCQRSLHPCQCGEIEPVLSYL